LALVLALLGKPVALGLGMYVLVNITGNVSSTTAEMADRGVTSTAIFLNPASHLR